MKESSVQCLTNLNCVLLKIMKSTLQIHRARFGKKQQKERKKENKRKTDYNRRNDGD